MKRKVLSIFALTFTCASMSLYGQEETQTKYMRSSLSMVLLENDGSNVKISDVVSNPVLEKIEAFKSGALVKKDTVLNSWKNYPFPDKYNNHEIKTTNVMIDKITLSDEELKQHGFLKDTLEGKVNLLKAEASYKRLKYLNKERTKAVVLPSEKEEYKLKLDKFIISNKVANQVVKSWFYNSELDTLDMNLIKQRGSYNATEMDAQIAKGQTRGLAALQDAGEHLISNSFISFTKFSFYENEPMARVVRDAAKKATQEQLAGKPQILIDKALQALDAVYDKTKEGYTLVSTTWLYQLDWNDSINTAYFQKGCWNNADNQPDSYYDYGSPKKLENLTFNLNFVGVQSNSSIVLPDLSGKRSEAQTIDIAVVRNVDNVFSKLQQEYEVFRPMTPVYSTNPITAQVGMKESLKGGESFDVFELTMNSKTNKTEYKKVGSITLDKNGIWDNRYNAGEAPEKVTTDKNGNPLQGSIFKGSGKIQKGMLLKQAK
ncbi:MAG TPA: hypothetical protein PLP27_05240 [Crocinitomicaceae bacterium]|nr:hypothetical protein [Crocinitomicaceae bacterium]